MSTEYKYLNVSFENGSYYYIVDIRQKSFRFKKRFSYNELGKKNALDYILRKLDFLDGVEL